MTKRGIVKQKKQHIAKSPALSILEVVSWVYVSQIYCCVQFMCVLYIK